MSHVVKPAFILFAITAIITSLIAVVHGFTLEPINAQIKKAQDEAMAQVLPQAANFEQMEAEVTGNIIQIFKGLDGGSTVGYVFELSQPGYSGNISIMVGISSEDDVISGMRVLKHTETPGLGANATKESFYQQYDGKALTELRVVKMAPNDNEIEAITSSTITTKAITDAVNEAVNWYKEGVAK